MRWYLIFVLLILCTYGCAPIDINEGAAPGVRVNDPAAPNAGIRLNTVNIIDESLQKWHGREAGKTGKIAVESTNSKRTATGTLEAWGVLRNRTDYPLQIEGRITFFDQYQVPVESPSAWRRVLLPANGIGAYKEFSTKTSQVAYYYIELREGR